MKYTITINQSAVFKNGLINKTDSVDWIIIDYLKDFAIYKKAKKIYVRNSPRPSQTINQSNKSNLPNNVNRISSSISQIQEGRGEEYIWLNYNHLIVSLPLLHIKTKSSISARINKLVKLELLKTYRDNDNTLYYTFTDKMIEIIFARNCDVNRIQAQKLMTDKSKLTDPVRETITGGVRAGITAQYKTKISIINKDNNNKETSFSSSFLKNKTKEYKPQTCPVPFVINETDKISKSNISNWDRSKGARVNTDRHRFSSFSTSPLMGEDKGEGERKRHTPHPNLLPQGAKGKKYVNPVNPVKGFHSLNRVWNVIDNIRQRQIQNKI